MSTRDALFEPLYGKRRTVRQALIEVAERWGRSPLADAGGRAALEDAVRHALRRGEIARELPAGTDLTAVAAAFVDGLVAGEGAAAVYHVFPLGRRAR
jgi:hypothetical protein